VATSLFGQAWWEQGLAEPSGRTAPKTPHGAKICMHVPAGPTTATTRLRARPRPSLWPSEEKNNTRVRVGDRVFNHCVLLATHGRAWATRERGALTTAPPPSHADIAHGCVAQHARSFSCHTLILITHPPYAKKGHGYDERRDGEWTDAYSTLARRTELPTHSPSSSILGSAAIVET